MGGFPYVGVYLHAGANKVQCVWSHEGFLPKEELLQGLQSAVTHGKPVVLQQRIAEETRQADRLLREEQEAMYQETMVQDMQRQAQAEAAEQKDNLMDALKMSRQMVRMTAPFLKHGTACHATMHARCSTSLNAGSCTAGKRRRTGRSTCTC